MTKERLTQLRNSLNRTKYLRTQTSNRVADLREELAREEHALMKLELDLDVLKEQIQKEKVEDAKRQWLLNKTGSDKYTEIESALVRADKMGNTFIVYQERDGSICCKKCGDVVWTGSAKQFVKMVKESIEDQQGGSANDS